MIPPVIPNDLDSKTRALLEEAAKIERQSKIQYWIKEIIGPLTNGSVVLGFTFFASHLTRSAWYALPLVGLCSFLLFHAEKWDEEDRTTRIVQASIRVRRESFDDWTMSYREPFRLVADPHYRNMSRCKQFALSLLIGLAGFYAVRFGVLQLVPVR